MKRRSVPSPEMPIAPMIDCVFLMLVYFMTTSSLKKAEADMLLHLGSGAHEIEMVPAVDHQKIVILSNGRAAINGYVADDTDEGMRHGLIDQLSAMKAVAESAGSELRITIYPADDVKHYAIVDVLEALNVSGIESVQFP